MRSFFEKTIAPFVSLWADKIEDVRSQQVPEARAANMLGLRSAFKSALEDAGRGEYFRRGVPGGGLIATGILALAGAVGTPFLLAASGIAAVAIVAGTALTVKYYRNEKALEKAGSAISDKLRAETAELAQAVPEQRRSTALKMFLKAQFTGPASPHENYDGLVSAARKVLAPKLQA